MMYRSQINWPMPIALLAVCALVGCGKSDPPAFRLDMVNVVDKQFAPEQRQSIADILQAMFGTPDEPFVLPETGLDQRLLRMSAGPVWSDDLSGKHGLYRLHCAHCHGISGDGRGPTAMILNPYPRDYRLGVFKFKGTYREARPSDDDLRRVLHNGVPGTAMPSFALLPPDEVESLMEYVKYLSMRGQFETALMRYVYDEDITEPLNPAEDAELRDTLGDFLTEIAEGWKTANEQVIMPEEPSIPPAERTPEVLAESIAKGRDLFYGTKANCFSCHGPTGLGDGQQTDFDDWTKPQKEFIDITNSLPDTIQAAKEELADLEGEDHDNAQLRLDERARELAERRMLVGHLLPVRNAIPRNLRDGMYRGGDRPIDIFWRISSGIPGTPMPAAGAASPGATPTLTQEEIWQIVDYVHSLPFEPASQPLKRPTNVAEVTR